MSSMKGKTVIVTGGAGSIGSAAVRRLAEEGCNVVFCDIKAEAGKALELELKEKGLSVVFTEVDVTKVEENERLVALACECFGKLDGIACCAGINICKPFDEYTTEEFLLCCSVNLDAGFYLAQKAVPELIKAGGGSIVFLGDGCMDMPLPGMTGSLIPKKGLQFLCRHIGVEYGRDNVRANMLSPTLVEGGFWEGNETQWELTKACANSKHTFCAEDLVGSLVFLLSDDSKMVTASVLKANDNFDCGFAYDMWVGMKK